VVCSHYKRSGNVASHSSGILAGRMIDHVTNGKIEEMTGDNSPHNRK